EQKHPWILFVTSTQIDVELLQAIENGQEVVKIQKYKEVPFLFIDDLGTERSSERIVRQYYQIIDHRQSNMMSTIYSSNLTIEQLKDVLGDRTYSRMKLSYQLKFPDEDLRNKGKLPKL